jgi:hypothetical protein
MVMEMPVEKGSVDGRVRERHTPEIARVQVVDGKGEWGMIADTHKHRVKIIQGTAKFVATEVEKALDNGWGIDDPILPTGQKIGVGNSYEAQLMAVLYKLEVVK